MFCTDKIDKKCCPWLHLVIGILVAVAFISLSLFLISAARNSLRNYKYIGKPSELQNIISITGAGKVTAIPNVGQVNIGVTSDSVSAAKAQEENTKKMNEIIKVIKDKGIESKDIKTSYYYINPKYEYRDGNSNIVGYTVSQSVDVTIRNTDKISEILKAATDKGANNVGGLTFKVDKPETLKAEAREKAIQDAQEKANALARILHVNLGRITSFSESTPSPMYYDNYSKGYGGMGPTMEAVTPPVIAAGETEIEIQVYINYEIL